MKYKKGDILVNNHGEKIKVLEVLGDIYFMSSWDDLAICGHSFTEKELDQRNITLYTKEPGDGLGWLPKVGEEYWCIYDAYTDNYGWCGDVFDIKQRKTFGVYRTIEEAEEVRKKLLEFARTLRKY